MTQNDALLQAKAYLFDMDGTLVDNCSYHVLSWQAFSEKYGNKLSKQQILNWMGATNRDYQERIFRRTLTDEEAKAYEEEKESLYRELYRPHMQLPPGLRIFLDRTHAHGIMCGIASGAPQRNIDFICAGLDIYKDFSCIIDASKYTRSKPDPDCYLTAARQLGVAPEECVVFEDAVGGIEAGKRAGMRVIAITHTNPREVLATAHPDLIIDSFTELL